MPNERFIPGRVVRESRQSVTNRVFRNRYNPESRFVTPRDVWLNLKELFFCWLNRVPPGATLRWRAGRIVSYITRRER